MEFNEIFDKCLTEKGITTYKMGAETGISSSLIGYWRRGQRKPTLDNIIAICNYLDVSPTFLLTGKEDRVADISLSEGERDILELVHSLSPKEQQRVVGVIEGYLGRRQTPPKSIPTSPKPSTPSASTTPSDDEFREHIQENFSDTLELIAKLAK